MDGERHLSPGRVGRGLMRACEEKVVLGRAGLAGREDGVACVE